MLRRIKLISLTGLFLLLTMANLAKADSLSPSEEKLTHYLLKNQDQELALLEKLVNINSGTTNLSGIRTVGEILAKELQSLGFKTHWAAEPESMQRAPTLVAEHPGSQGNKLLLIGHLDTVFPSNSPFQHFEPHGESASGPGIIDDKGGDLVLLYALKALAASGDLADAKITVVLTGDEEDSGKPVEISRKALFSAAHETDVALDFEWATSPNTATIARRGIAHWLLESQGREGHSSDIFADAGAGAIFELARVLDTMRRDLTGEANLSFSPGLVVGGTQIEYQAKDAKATVWGKDNVIAKLASASGDLRFLTEDQRLSAQNKMLEISHASLPHTQSALHFEEGIPPMPLTPGNEDLLQQYSQASIDLGYGPVKALPPDARGAGDISHIAAFVKANLAGLGPVGTGAHSTKETLDLPSLAVQTQRAAILIYRLTR